MVSPEELSTQRLILCQGPVALPPASCHSAPEPGGKGKHEQAGGVRGTPAGARSAGRFPTSHQAGRAGISPAQVWKRSGAWFYKGLPKYILPLKTPGRADDPHFRPLPVEPAQQEPRSTETSRVYAWARGRAVSSDSDSDLDLSSSSLEDRLPPGGLRDPRDDKPWGESGKGHGRPLSVPSACPERRCVGARSRLSGGSVWGQAARGNGSQTLPGSFLTGAGALGQPVLLDMTFDSTNQCLGGRICFPPPSAFLYPFSPRSPPCGPSISLSPDLYLLSYPQPSLPACSF
ncbi:hypothetical protein MC885_004694 [Smutsia gigantea]|nr:hypothetical protein MC885_004694 [Smutsia gigantea]